MMNKSDIVFDTQKSPDKYKKVMENIRKYKLSGDKRAKDWLDKEAASKQTDSDYGYRKYERGKRGIDKNKYNTKVNKLTQNPLGDYNKIEQTTGGNGPIRDEKIEEIVNPIQNSVAKIPKKPTESELEVPIIEENENPLKYTNVLNNIIQGTKTPEKSTRRYYTPETLQSIDRSYAIRNAIIEERNAEKESLRGKGLSLSSIIIFNKLK